LPVSLADVKHQAHAQKILQRAVERDRVHHAYIFHGPDGVGKEAMACGLAQLLLCSDPISHHAEPDAADEIGVAQLRLGCGKCDDCRMIQSGSHPDLHMVYRQLNREHPESKVRSRKAIEIGVDVLRYFVIDRVGLKPGRGRVKMFIIREADRITPPAQNALLKTLEEPPGATVLVLLVSALDRLLPTTLSRCQVVRFDPLPTTFVRRELARLLSDLPAAELDWYSRCSDGSLGLAVQRAEDAWYELNQRVVAGLASPNDEFRGDDAKAWIDESKALGQRYRKRDPEITETEAGRRGLKAISQLTATFYADVLRFSSGERSAIVNASQLSQIGEISQQVAPQKAAEAIGRIALAERHLDLNANTQLVIEALIVDLARLSDPSLTAAR
jgi:DNA polymerase-3 subunit delta'